MSFLRVPDEKVKEVISSEKYVEIQIKDIANGTGEEENNDKKSACNFDCNSNFSFDMDSISLDTGCNPVRKVKSWEFEVFFFNFFNFLQCDNDKVVRTESFYSLNSHKSAYLSVDKTSSYQSLPEITKNNKKMIYGPVSQLPSLNKPVPKSWEVYQGTLNFFLVYCRYDEWNYCKKFSGDFVMIHASYQSHLAGDVLFAPSCKPNDGIIWLLVIKAGISRVNLLQVRNFFSPTTSTSISVYLLNLTCTNCVLF